MPFHQFSHFTGRLRQSNQLLPLYPIRPVPLQSSEPPQMMFETIKTKPVQAAAAGSAGSSGSAGSAASKLSDFGPHVSPKNREFMRKLQSDLEAPVFLAKGLPDKILFGVTVALVTVGMIESVRFIYLRATKRI